MAIGPATVWRVRTGGNNANGGGYDATISGAGTDYSQQDSPQLALTDIACSGTTTVTSATGGFTSAMIGNGFRISSAWYFITGQTDTNTVTVDRTPGTISGVSGRVGGGLATFQSVMDSSNSTGNKCVAGNTIYIRGSGSDDPSSADYTFTGYLNTVVGNTTDGYVRLIGENGRPRLLGNGLIWYNAAFNYFENLYLHTNSNNYNYMGFIITSSNPITLRNCVLNLGNIAGMVGVTFSHGGGLYNCEVYGGSTSPTFSSGSYGVKVDGYAPEIVGCYIHHCRDHGIYAGGATNYPALIRGNIIYANANDGVYITNHSYMSGEICGNTIDANAGNGITITSSLSLLWNSFYNNIISNHVGGGKAGINVTAGSAAVNDRMKKLFDHNCLYNNTSNYTNISAGPNDVALDPQYADVAGLDWSVGTNMQALGFPSNIKKSATSTYVDLGGAQRQESGGSSGGVVVPSSIYGAEGMRVFV
jgi:hypothetical protein